MERLPPELWRQVLRHASCPETMLVVSDPFKSWMHAELYHRIHRIPPIATKTRLTLVLVCRLWYHLAMEFLYEDIAIRSVPQLGRLAQAIERSRRMVNGHKVGWWTKRFHLFEMPVANPQADWLLQASLAKILPFMPNLEHFFDDGTYGPGNKPLTSNTGSIVIKTGSQVHSLRTVHIRGSDMNFEALCSFLRTSSRLETLKLVRCTSAGPRKPSYSTIRLSRLHTLIIDSPSPNCEIISLTSSWDLPSLSTLIILGHEVPHVDAILRTHGAKLKTLALSMVIADSDLGPSLSCCSRLQHLIISLYLEVTPKYFRCLGATLLRIGIEDLEEFGDLDMRKHFPALYSRLDGFLSTFLGPGFSKLRCVVAVKSPPQKMHTALKLTPDRWQRWIPAFKSKGVQFQDGLGFHLWR